MSEGKQAKFYKSKRWKDTRESFMSYRNHLCENCLAKGRYVPAEIVHHKEHVTPENVNNPEITLSWDNLQALCRKCHAEQHDEMYNREGLRYEFVDGKILLH